LLIALALCAGAPAHADTVAPFYAGKTLNLVIGYAPGGGYDLYARTLARHIARHIPGNPTIVVQNMPGAGRPRISSMPSRPRTARPSAAFRAVRILIRCSAAAPARNTRP